MLRLPSWALLPLIALLAAVFGGYLTCRRVEVVLPAIAALVLARREPLHGAMLTLALTPLCGRAPGFFDPVAATAVGAVLGWLLLAVKSPFLDIPRRPTLICGAALFLIATASLFPAVLPNLPSAGPREFLQDALDVTVTSPLYSINSVYQLLTGLAFATLIASRADLPACRRLIATLLIAHAITLAIGLLDHAGVLSLTAIRPLSPGVLRSDHPHRLAAFFWHPSWYAQLLALMLPFSLAHAWCTHGPSRIASLALALLTLAALPLTFQRGGWIAAAAGVATLTALWLHRAGLTRLRARAPAFLVAALATALLIAVLSTISGQTGAVAARAGELRDVSGRTTLWRGALRIARERPLLGWGHNSFAWVYKQQIPPGDPDRYNQHDTAHNGYLQMLVGCGLAGLVALLALLVSTFVTGLTAARDRTRELPRTALLAGALGSLAAYSVHALVQELFYIHALALVFWTLTGIILALSAAAAKAARRERVRKPPSQLPDAAEAMA